MSSDETIAIDGNVYRALPIELYEQVASNLTPNDLARLARVSDLFTSLSTRLLYRAICLPCSTRAGTVVELFQTLRDHQHLSELVIRVDVAWDPASAIITASMPASPVSVEEDKDWDENLTEYVVAAPGRHPTGSVIAQALTSGKLQNMEFLSISSALELGGPFFLGREGNSSHKGTILPRLRQLHLFSVPFHSSYGVPAFVAEHPALESLTLFGLSASLPRALTRLKKLHTLRSAGIGHDWRGTLGRSGTDAKDSRTPQVPNVRRLDLPHEDLISDEKYFFALQKVFPGVTQVIITRELSTFAFRAGWAANQPTWESVRRIALRWCISESLTSPTQVVRGLLFLGRACPGIRTVDILCLCPDPWHKHLGADLIRAASKDVIRVILPHLKDLHIMTFAGRAFCRRVDESTPSALDDFEEQPITAQHEVPIVPFHLL